MNDRVRYSIAEGMTPSLTFAEDLRLYREVGADGIGIRQAQKLTDPTEDLRAFRESGLSASVCILRPNNLLPSPGHPEPSDPDERVAIICRALDQMAPFNPTCCICGPGPFGDYEPLEAWDLAVVGLQRIARHASDLGIAIGLEPIHPTISEMFSFLTTLPDAARMCQDIGAPNVGVIFDIWHFWGTPDIEEQIQQHADKIIAVQVDDRRADTRVWNDRALPGDGLSRVADMLAVLKASGYRGWLDLEVLSDESLHEDEPADSAWRGDRREILQLGLDRMRSMWGGDDPATQSTAGER